MTIGVICPSLCISPFSIACFALFCGQYSGLVFCELCALCGQSTQSFTGDRPKFRVQRRSPRSSRGLSEHGLIAGPAPLKESNLFASFDHDFGKPVHQARGIFPAPALIGKTVIGAGNHM